MQRMIVYMYKSRHEHVLKHTYFHFVEKNYNIFCKKKKPERSIYSMSEAIHTERRKKSHSWEQTGLKEIKIRTTRCFYLWLLPIWTKLHRYWKSNLTNTGAHMVCAMLKSLFIKFTPWGWETFLIVLSLSLSLSMCVS
jgi:hypothetical protein